MKIIRVKKEAKGTTFGSIATGELFEYCGEIYMKGYLLNIVTETQVKIFPAMLEPYIGILLENGKASGFLESHLVTPVSYKPLEIE